MPDLDLGVEVALTGDDALEGEVDLTGDADLMGDVDRSTGDFERNLDFDGSFLDDRMGDDVAAVTDGSCFLIGEVDLERDLSLSFLRRALLFSGGLSGGEDSR